MVLKCKMCGGDLEVNLEDNIAECQYCGTKQTIPCVDTQKKVNIFNKANAYRSKNEFDKAAVLYDSIVAEWPNEAEAYWGLCLCRYGIEYVTDPKTGKRIPTCHRTQYQSILDCQDYRTALEKSDREAREIYEEEAKYIDGVQKQILEISKKEETFDIFICYKETNESGERTKDSVIAQEIYTELTNKGYKVFFARITLEDKLGSSYEPYIFAALNSAKVMLAVGTKPEYYQAVWVRNEWSRYLALMEGGSRKTLIPCYQDMDAYELPDEFAALQGLDLGKLGAIQDLLRGVEKIIGGEKEGRKSQTAVVTVDTLTQRGFLCLEDGEMQKAYDIFERILEMTPESSRAYIGMLMAEFGIKREDEIWRIYSLQSLTRFKRAMQYASAEYREFLSRMLEKNTKILQADNERIQWTKNIFEDWCKKILELEDKKKVLEEEIDQKYGKIIFNHRKKSKIILIFGVMLSLLPVAQGFLIAVLRENSIVLPGMVLLILFVAGLLVIGYSITYGNKEGQIMHDWEKEEKDTINPITQKEKTYLNSQLCTYCGTDMGMYACPKCGGAVYLTVQAYINSKDRALEFFRDARPKTYKGDEIGSEI